MRSAFSRCVERRTQYGSAERSYTHPQPFHTVGAVFCVERCFLCGIFLCPTLHSKPCWGLSTSAHKHGPTHRRDTATGSPVSPSTTHSGGRTALQVHCRQWGACRTAVRPAAGTARRCRRRLTLSRLSLALHSAQRGSCHFGATSLGVWRYFHVVPRILEPYPLCPQNRFHRFPWLLNATTA